MACHVTSCHNRSRDPGNSFLQEFQQAVVLLRSSDRNAQAICAVQLVAAESHHNSVVGHALVDLLRVVHLKKKRVDVFVWFEATQGWMDDGIRLGSVGGN